MNKKLLNDSERLDIPARIFGVHFPFRVEPSTFNMARLGNVLANTLIGNSAQMFLQEEPVIHGIKQGRHRTVEISLGVPFRRQGWEGPLKQWRLTSSYRH